MAKKTDENTPTYVVQIKCYNCDHIGPKEFPKGTPVPPDGITCPNCGCDTAMKHNGISPLPSTWVPHIDKKVWMYPVNPWVQEKQEPKYPFDISCETIPLNTDLHGNW